MHSFGAVSLSTWTNISFMFSPVQVNVHQLAAKFVSVMLHLAYSMIFHIFVENSYLLWPKKMLRER